MHEGHMNAGTGYGWCRAKGLNCVPHAAHVTTASFQMDCKPRSSNRGEGVRASGRLGQKQALLQLVQVHSPQNYSYVVSPSQSQVYFSNLGIHVNTESYLSHCCHLGLWLQFVIHPSPTNRPGGHTLELNMGLEVPPCPRFLLTPSSIGLKPIQASAHRKDLQPDPQLHRYPFMLQYQSK